jgi:hypothetical protein
MDGGKVVPALVLQLIVVSHRIIKDRFVES